MIVDLALILICAGVMTLIFKKLKQPLVLGYIVAGFLASPNMTYMPSVSDLEGVHLWSDIGVIFLLFALGLEFSFKKIMKMGAAPIIAACTIILCMMAVGFFTGHIFGWGQMDCIFLGGMLAMSSTTIIFKAFDDMGLRQQRFASMVLSVLIIEDILAIVLMVLLSTLAVSQQFEGMQMATSIVKLVFFNVKGRDLMAIDEPNTSLSPEDKAIYESLGLSTEPFSNVRYYYPFDKSASNKVSTYATKDDVEAQRKKKKASTTPSSMSTSWSVRTTSPLTESCPTAPSFRSSGTGPGRNRYGNSSRMISENRKARFLSGVHPAWIVLAGCSLLFFCTTGLIANANAAYQPYIRNLNGFTNAQTSTLMTIRNLVKSYRNC